MNVWNGFYFTYYIYITFLFGWTELTITYIFLFAAYLIVL
jgi:hypothetical protein